MAQVLPTLGGGVVCISEKLRDTADCLLSLKRRKIPETLAADSQARVIRGRSGIAVARIQAQRNEWNLQMLDMKRPLAVP
jgi:hypothetical protein